MTGGQSAMSWCQAPISDPQPIFSFFNYFWTVTDLVMWGALYNSLGEPHWKPLFTQPYPNNSQDFNNINKCYLIMDYSSFVEVLASVA
jgi:hypothetical protein